MLECMSHFVNGFYLANEAYPVGCLYSSRNRTEGFEKFSALKFFYTLLVAPGCTYLEEQMIIVDW